MTTLRKAREEGKLDQFAADHKTDAPGDADRFNATLTAMARKSKAVPATSSEPDPAD